MGTLLASGVFVYLGTLPTEVLLSGVWRIPFLASILLIGVALFIRMRLRETPTFIVLEKQDQIAESPMREIFHDSFPSVLRGIGLRMAENGGSYIFSTLAVSFVVTTIGVGAWIGPLAVAVGSLVGMISVPLAGHISDRVGRVPVYRFGAAILLVLAFPGWWLLSLGNPIVVIIVIAVAIGLGVNTMLGAQCALLPEMFGNRHRYLGVATSREFSAVLAGGIAPVLGAFLITISGGAWWPLAIYVFVLAAITFATTFITPETRGRDLTLINDALQDSVEQVNNRPSHIDLNDRALAQTR